jgi:DNA (cytosine-5)-methyltransferase 1
MPTFGSLFAGIGGIDLGLERAGWECRWQVEWDAYCQRVLAKHWPDVPRYGDIATVDWSGVERVDLLAGGFPCQPFSVAGKQRRLADDRWLWPEFARAIRDLRPRYVLVENVPGLLVGGGMDAVLGELAELGFDAEWESIPAAAVGAPHLRYRVWIVAWHADRADGSTIAGRGGARAVAAHPDSDALRLQPVALGRSGRPAELGHDGTDWPLADSDNGGWNGRARAQRASGRTQPPNGGGVADPDEFDAQGFLTSLVDPQERGGSVERPARPRRDGVGWWATEPDVGRVAHGIPARVDRLRALGNAVVPQVVEVIGRALLRETAG